MMKINNRKIIKFFKTYQFYLSLIVIIMVIMVKGLILKYNYIERFNNITLDNVEDKLYIKLHDLVFNDNHIYENDIKIFNKYAQLDKWNKVKVLDAGTGFGRHYKYLPTNIDKIGVDKEQLYLDRAEIRNPGSNLVLGRLENYELFEFENFTHILCTIDTIYNNRPEQEMNDVLNNFKFWLKKDGILAIHIFDNTKLDPSPRDFSISYLDKKKNKHALTYFENFTHDAVFENVSDNIYNYIEKYIVKSGNSITKSRTLYMIPKNEMIQKIIDNGFMLYNKENIDGISDYSFYFFKKL
jgi:hypothetical protein